MGKGLYMILHSLSVWERGYTQNSQSMGGKDYIPNCTPYHCEGGVIALYQCEKGVIDNITLPVPYEKRG